MGEVYRARMETIDGVEKLVALKLVRPHLASNQEFARLFMDEAKIAMSLSHANVVHSFDVGRIDDRLFLAMEFVEGVTVHALMRHCTEHLGTAIPSRFVVYVAVEVLKGLSYAHRRKGKKGSVVAIVHRDISPSNILISREGEVKVADFGIAKSALRSSHTVTGRVKGKLPYISPEQLRQTGVDPRTDVYALGAVMYEMLADRWMVDPSSPTEAMDQILSGKHEPLMSVAPTLDPALCDIVMRAVSVDPDDRFPNAAAMRDALERHALDSRYLLSSSDLANLLDEVHAASVPTRSTLDPPVTSVVPGATSTPPVNGMPFNALLGAELRRLDTADAFSVYTTGFSVDGAVARTADVVPEAPNRVEEPYRGDNLPSEEGYAETTDDTQRLQRAARTRYVWPLLLLMGVAVGWRAFLATGPETSREQAMAHESASATENESRTERATVSAAKTEVVAEPEPATATTEDLQSAAADAAGADVQQVEPDMAQQETRPPVPRKTRRAVSARALVEPGFLSINSQPWSYVSVDGKRLKATPVVRHELAPGRHLIRLRNPDAGLERTVVVQVKSGQTNRLRIDLADGS